MAWEPWAGGRVWVEDNTRVYHLRRRLGDGARVQMSLGVSTLPDAMAELALFESDPAGYKIRKHRAAAVHRRGGGTAVRIDVDTLEDFLDWARAQVLKGTLSDGYVKHTLGPYLTRWGKALGGRDLHRVSLDELQALLRRKDWATAQHKRIVALKAFAAWAREEKEAPKLRRQEDPTIDLKTPPITPEKKRRKKGYSIAFVEKLYSSLESQASRDMIRMRACAHGLHDTEISRIASGDGEIVHVSDPSGIAGLLVFRHAKKREDHAIPVDAATLAAAERLRARGSSVSASAMRTMLERVAIRWHGCGGITEAGTRKKGKHVGEKYWETRPCKKCQRIAPSELRHSFATWAATVGEKVFATGQKGVDVESIAASMGHLNKATTSGFYIGDRIPMMIRIPISLTHPEDPTPIAPSRVGHQKTG